MEHTTGDWTVTGFEGNDRSNPELSIIDDCGYQIATLAVDHKTNDEVLANATLIAQAPRLLKSIQRFFAATDNDKKHHAMVAMEEAARMATGGKP